jgi:hypothetical protein
MPPLGPAIPIISWQSHTQRLQCQERKGESSGDVPSKEKNQEGSPSGFSSSDKMDEKAVRKP